MRIAGIGRLFFALGLAGFGVLQFIYGDFIPGRAPAWPAAMPGRVVWACASGAMLIAASAAIVSGLWARWAAVASGSMIFLWALLRHVPLVLANPHGVVLTASGKALALCGGAFAVAGSVPVNQDRSKILPGAIDSTRLLYLGRCGLGVFMMLGGVQHFIYTGFVATLVPAWIPAHVFWTYFAGAALIAGGAGLIIPQTTQLAGMLAGAMLLLWVVLLHVPRAAAAADPQRRNEWTAVFEALSMSGIAFVLAGNPPGLFPRPKGSRR